MRIQFPTLLLLVINKRGIGMKIAVTSLGDTVDSQVDPRFGRTGKFIVCDTDTGETQVIDNTQSLNIASGAGIQTGENLSRLGVKCVITGHCGPKAFRTLQSAGIKVLVGAKGTVAEVIEQFKSGKLSQAETPDVEGRWM